MIDAGTGFSKRVKLFYIDLKRGIYPNATTLAERAGCSRNTAARCIERLQLEYHMPVAYDSSEKGYYLTDKDYELAALPAGKDELTALFLLKDLASLIESSDLHQALERLWISAVAGNPRLGRELETLSRYFTSDLTTVGTLADCGLLEYISAAWHGESLKIDYKSPWRHQELHTYRGRLLRVHFSDGHLYLLFQDESGREIVLNSSFVKKIEILNESLNFRASNQPPTRFLEGFGIWTGEDLEEVEIHITPPAAEYYKAQVWHESQDDKLEDGILIRKMRAHISPELVRRILSLGRYVKEIKPARLKDMVMQDASALLSSLKH